ncbi:hypothetical protein MMC19_000191 [Ptychographa xylographoides]|nr:hypothetical protein [Ptychographa xylographoides]
MSSDSFAISRKGLSGDLKKLAEQHLKHDLNQADRDTLEAAASKFSTHIAVGSLIGLGLGIALAYRIRSQRVKIFDAFRTKQKPTHVKFADGREEAIPDITPLLKPTTGGDIAAYAFFSIAGVFLGGETGALTGSTSAQRTITKDPESRARIGKAFKGFRADMLRKEIELLEGGRSDSGMWPEV